MSTFEETLILENYSEKYRAAVEDYFAEFARNGENAREDVYGGFSYTWLYFREGDGRLLGMINIRRGEERAVSEAGNIGYAIRPSERRKGYGYRLLESGIELCRMLGMKEVTAVVKAENTAGLALARSCGFLKTGVASGGETCFFTLTTD